ncbi:sensor histidine kinase [Sporosarcina jiandibaonis]|uniref:sensor histidine kinase n=1 Tax=Sporosarcina jiandibaonis TaxID=2715535 RepID=UPI00155241EB|nr:HAMP domain-containing sensor histidine kinase [Sporosarcina jiandibaonis]
MKNNKIQLFVWSLLAALLLIAIPSALKFSPTYIGKSYLDTDDFKRELSNFYDMLGPAVLNPLDIEEAKKKIPVTRDEIEHHRNYYGSLSDQLTNIHDQYEERINEAESSGNEKLASALVKERDIKIADIEKNFESDEHVAAKIRAEKEVVLEKYINEIKGAELSPFPIAYQLTDVETGETFSSGSVNVKPVYKKVFGQEDGLFKANSIPRNGYDEGDYAPYISYEVAELTNGDMSLFKKPERTFEGEVIVPDTALASGYLKSQVAEFNKRKYATYAIWILGILSAVVLFTIVKFRKEWVTNTSLSARYDNLKIDMKAALFFLSVLITTEIIYRNAQPSHYFQIYSGNLLVHGSWLVIFAIAIAAIAFQLVNCVERWKRKGVLEQDVAHSYVLKFFRSLQEVFMRKTIGMQMFILLIGFFGIQTFVLLFGFFIAGMYFHPFYLVIYAIFVVFLGLPALYIFVRRLAYLNRIIIATEKMAQGRLQDEIRIEGKSPLADHARNLNNLREGVKVSLTEQAKSERLKTELITNVSHDLRTPLTSIITYTDLLKSPELTEEERRKYVDILDKKSQRLKTLIEDLFEVSKMASGNLELHKQRVDLTQLLQQALAEHADDISTNGLDFRVNLPDAEIVANVDGQRWWRVLDNLIVNAIKYSMPGTRVYITLKQAGELAKFELKNISKYELNENGDELFERFKRADTSRHTDGSGLGLAIAQSIVDMHAGEMKIEVDGDLFKVTVLVPVI